MQPKPHAIILDIDGTLCDNRSIIHMLTDKANRDYDGYHVKSIDLPVHADVLKIAREARMQGLAILVVTARPERFRKVTFDWLLKNNIPMDEFHMRPDSDFRPDDEAKRTILADLRTRYDIVHAVDDNPVNAKLFREEKIGVTFIPGYGNGNYLGDRPDNGLTVPSPIGSGKCLRCGRALKSLKFLFGPTCAKHR